MKLVAVVLIAISASTAAAQQAASTPVPSPTPEATATPDQLLPPDLGTSAPTPSRGADAVPELSQLDAAFHRSSLGKVADEAKLRAQARELRNRLVSDPAIVAANKEANDAPTDLEKRERLRNYYELLYGRMRALAPSDDLRKFIDVEKTAHLVEINQPRVRPLPGVSATPIPTHRKKKKSDTSKLPH